MEKDNAINYTPIQLVQRVIPSRRFFSFEDKLDESSTIKEDITEITVGSSENHLNNGYLSEENVFLLGQHPTFPYQDKMMNTFAF